MIGRTAGVFLLLFSTPALWAQSYHFQNYSVEHGLAQSTILATLQDQNGYLWIATDGGGVSRFDGLSFETFTVEDGLTNNAVSSIMEDADGDLWFGTHDGVSRFDGLSFSTLAWPNSAEVAVLDILQTRAGGVWLATNRGLFEYDGVAVTRFRPELTDLAEGVDSLFEDRDGRLWIGTATGVVASFDGSAVKSFGVESGLPTGRVHDILEDRSGRLWIAGRSGTGRLQDGVFESFSLGDMVERRDVRALTVTEDGTLWFGTNGGGLCRYDADELRCMTEASGLSSNFIWSLTEDREGGLWIGTYRGGIDRFSGERFVRLPTEEGLETDIVRAVLEDRKGRLWFGTFRGGVAMWDGERLTRYTTRDGLASDFVLTIFEDHTSNLWFGTFDGVSRFDGTRFTNYHEEDGVPDRVIRAISQDAAGQIWIGGNSGGVSVIDGDRVRRFTREDGLSDNHINAFAPGSSGVFWIATAGGISRWENRELTPFDTGSPPIQQAYAILEDRVGYLWIAEYGRGLRRCPGSGGIGGSCQSFTRRDGLVSNAVVSLALDMNGYLWAGTEGGISRFDLPKFETDGEIVFKNYGPEDGFSAVECIQNAILVDTKEDIWFGTVAGAYRYRAREDSNHSIAPLTRVTDLRIFYEHVNWREFGGGSHGNNLPENLALPDDRNHLTFDFLGLSLASPSRVRYRHMLEGWDPEWSLPSLERQATYQHLPPGSYEFLVKAESADRLWSATPASYRFTILPPFWRTGWFVAVSLASTIVLLLGLVKVGVWRVEKQRRHLEEQIAQSTAALRVEKEKVERVNDELEQRVAERTGELVQTNASLRDQIARAAKLEDELLNARKLESIGVLAGGIAHDFNNLLTAMLGNISLARRINGAQGPSEELLSEAQTACHRAAELTEQLLTFSKGGLPIKNNVRLSELVPETSEFALRGSNVRCELELPSGLWQIHADSGQIGQVIHNLLLNAAQSMPGGGVVRVACSNCEIAANEIAKVEAGPYVELSVEDHGVGIRKEDLPRIFDPYFTTKGEGSGLGLASAYSIVNKHGGAFKVDSDPERGTTVRVYLPASTSATGAEEAPDPTPLRRFSGAGRILVMDDDESIQRTAKKILSRFGYDVSLAADGEAAVALFRRAAASSDGFDLVIMDLTVPAGMGGKEAVAKLKEIAPDVKVVVSSGYSSDPVMAAYREHGFCDVLPKPFEAGSLGALVERVLK